MPMSRRGWVTVDRRWLAIVGVLVLAVLVPVVVWHFQGAGMRSAFVEALRTGDVGGLPIDLQGKEWSEQELAGAEVIKAPDGSNTERAISQRIHDRGRLFLPSNRYEYQGTIEDGRTGILHVFGYQREEPRRWRWLSIHPSSIKRHIERVQERVDELKRRAKPT
jgi:hypothetical protein